MNSAPLSVSMVWTLLAGCEEAAIVAATVAGLAVRHDVDLGEAARPLDGDEDELARLRELARY